jgi:hypothetical protein
VPGLTVDDGAPTRHGVQSVQSETVQRGLFVGRDLGPNQLGELDRAQLGAAGRPGPHSGTVSVVEATYLGSVLSRLATGSSESVTFGQKAAKMSYVCRPVDREERGRFIALSF